LPGSVQRGASAAVRSGKAKTLAAAVEPLLPETQNGEDGIPGQRPNGTPSFNNSALSEASAGLARLLEARKAALGGTDSSDRPSQIVALGRDMQALTQPRARLGRRVGPKDPLWSAEAQAALWRAC